MINSSPKQPIYPSQTDSSSVSAQFSMTNTNIHGHSGAATDGGQINFNNLIGNFETVSEVPTGIPSTPYDQIKIFYKNLVPISSSIYWYSTIDKGWHHADENPMYTGIFVSSTAQYRSPYGWTITSPSTGNFTITHNLSNTDYIVIATAGDSTGISGVYVPSFSANSFNIVTTVGGAVAQAGFTFSLSTYT